ncbi:hypothetical protein MRB53_001080 [Persea americana]|uniref:Uncharacterized protein n=1 Tax=Persea americana TaxID=3435 RepID=A0ACC2MQM0_PERAE|nr:hypothetical protein MRB53_001080 [Persea americana]
MASKIWEAGLALSLVCTAMASLGPVRASSSSDAAICPAASPVNSILQLPDSCSDSDRDPIGVTEGDEVSLQKASILVHKDTHKFVSVLFYASWCPFSRTLRTNFTILSSLFPTIRHIAIEESSIRPSILSRYGVHGFPTLFVLNSTMRVRYRGSRTLDSLMAFYNDVTGIRAASLDGNMFERIWDQLNLTKIASTEQECPFSWARSPEKLLQQETYLALAIAFVLLRLIYILLPTVRVCLERAWRGRMRNMSLMRFWEHPKSRLEHAVQVLSRRKSSKRSNLQEGAMNAKAWASKSLATVAISEASSSRVFFGGERL